MKKLSYLFVIIFWLCVTSVFGQVFVAPGWVDIQLYTDGFPGETSWTMTPPGGSPIYCRK